VLDMKCIGLKSTINRLKSKEPLTVLWRCTVKGRVNLAHFYSLLRLKKLQSHGCTCVILLSDLEAYLDGGKCPWTALKARSNYYAAVLREFMSVIRLDNVEIRYSRDYQFNEESILDMYKISSKVTMGESEMLNGTTLGSHLCPVYFALDLIVSQPDLVLIGEDQLPYAKLYLEAEGNGWEANEFYAARVSPRTIRYSQANQAKDQ